MLAIQTVANVASLMDTKIIVLTDSKICFTGIKIDAPTGKDQFLMDFLSTSKCFFLKCFNGWL